MLLCVFFFVDEEIVCFVLFFYNLCVCCPMIASLSVGGELWFEEGVPPGVDDVVVVFLRRRVFPPPVTRGGRRRRFFTSSGNSFRLFFFFEDEGYMIAFSEGVAAVVPEASDARGDAFGDAIFGTSANRLSEVRSHERQRPT